MRIAHVGTRRRQTVPGDYVSNMNFVAMVILPSRQWHAAQSAADFDLKLLFRTVCEIGVLKREHRLNYDRF
jgi:hypothetical protein